MTAVTAIKIVDASALAAVIFEEPDSAIMIPLLRTERLMAPAIFGFEMANICLNKMRRNPDMRQTIRNQYRLINQFKIEIQTVDDQAVLDLAVETGLSAYDASYLWLARELNCELVTLDKKLAAAAAQ